MSPTHLPYGAWPSPITAVRLVSGASGCNEVLTDGDDVWVAESRPDEAGRTVLLRYREPVGSAAVEITANDVDVRTRVHEYGGGAWWVSDGLLVFSNDADQRLWKLETSTVASALALTPEPPTDRSLRYADGRITPDGAHVVCVREEHTEHTGTSVLPTNTVSYTHLTLPTTPYV